MARGHRLIYTIEKAELITAQLQRFSSGHSHHIAGQYANIMFWVSELEQSLKALDEYGSRFNSMRKAQEEWVEQQGTEVHNYCAICQGRCEFCNGRPPTPARMRNSTIQETRRKLSEAGYEFLLRCYRIDLVEKNELKDLCTRIGSGLDPADLEAEL